MINLLIFPDLSPPQNISVVPLSPTTLRVLWSPSTTESVNYQVFWRWEGIVEGKTHIQSGELHNDHSPGDRDIVKWADMSDLNPGQEYVLWVSLSNLRFTSRLQEAPGAHTSCVWSPHRFANKPTWPFGLLLMFIYCFSLTYL